MHKWNKSLKGIRSVNKSPLKGNAHIEKTKKIWTLKTFACTRISYSHQQLQLCSTSGVEFIKHVIQIEISLHNKNVLNLMHNLCFQSKNITKNGTLVSYEAKGEFIIGKN